MTERELQEIREYLARDEFFVRQMYAYFEEKHKVWEGDPFIRMKLYCNILRPMDSRDNIRPGDRVIHANHRSIRCSLRDQDILYDTVDILSSSAVYNDCFDIFANRAYKREGDCNFEGDYCLVCEPYIAEIKAVQFETGGIEDDHSATFRLEILGALRLRGRILDYKHIVRLENPLYCPGGRTSRITVALNNSNLRGTYKPINTEQGEKCRYVDLG